MPPSPEPETPPSETAILIATAVTAAVAEETAERAETTADEALEAVEEQESEIQCLRSQLNVLSEQVSILLALQSSPANSDLNSSQTTEPETLPPSSEMEAATAEELAEVTAHAETAEAVMTTEPLTPPDMPGSTSETPMEVIAVSEAQTLAVVPQPASAGRVVIL